jgi:hypothetical protein
MPCTNIAVLPLPHVAILVSHNRCTLGRARSAVVNVKGVLLLLSLLLTVCEAQRILYAVRSNIVKRCLRATCVH